MTTDVFSPAGAVKSDSFPTAAAGHPEWEETESQRRLPHPETGAPFWSTRASRWAGTLEDPYILRQWEKAMVAFGMGMREDLHALAASESHPGPHADRPSGWWKPWEKIAGQCLDAAEHKRGAHLGTAIHRFTENHDAGTLDMGDVPKKWRKHVAKYDQLHAALGLKINSIESMILTTVPLPTGLAETTTNPKRTFPVNGRLDRRRVCPDGRLVIDDLKTGRNAPLGLDGIAIQLAIYAHAEWDFDPKTGVWSRAPEVRKDVALVSWVPVDHPEDGELIPVDIAWGWHAAQVVAWVRDYRNAAKRTRDRGLRLPLSALLDGAGPAELTEDDVRERITAASTTDDLSTLYLEAFPAGLWSDDLDRLAKRRKAEIKGQKPELRVVQP